MKFKYSNKFYYQLICLMKKWNKVPLWLQKGVLTLSFRKKATQVLVNNF